MEPKPPRSKVFGIVVFLAVAAVIGAAALLPFLGEEPGLAPLVNFKAGTTWRYRDGFKGATRELEVKVVAQAPGSFECVEDGTRKCTWRLEGGFLVRERDEKRQRLLKEGTRKGHTWAVDASDPGGLAMKHMGLGPATAGGKRYENAINVRLQLADSWIDSYLVPGIGLVLEVESSYPAPDRPSAPIRTRELLSFDAK